jgi:predicted nucleic acid-binding protein
MSREDRSRFVGPNCGTHHARRDPENIPILGTAVAAEAKLLITVDKDLLAVGEYWGIAIVKPGTFWKLATE